MKGKVVIKDLWPQTSILGWYKCVRPRGGTGGIPTPNSLKLDLLTPIIPFMPRPRARFLPLENRSVSFRAAIPGVAFSMARSPPQEPQSSALTGQPRHILSNSLTITDDTLKLPFEQQHAQLVDACRSEAFVHGFKYFAAAAATSSALMFAALKTSPSVARALGPSGRTACVAIPAFGLFFLQSELYMLKCGRRVSEWKRSNTAANR